MLLVMLVKIHAHKCQNISTGTLHDVYLSAVYNTVKVLHITEAVHVYQWMHMWPY